MNKKKNNTHLCAGAAELLLLPIGTLSMYASTMSIGFISLWCLPMDVHLYIVIALVLCLLF